MIRGARRRFYLAAAGYHERQARAWSTEEQRLKACGSDWWRKARTKAHRHGYAAEVFRRRAGRLA